FCSRSRNTSTSMSGNLPQQEPWCLFWSIEVLACRDSRDVSAAASCRRHGKRHSESTRPVRYSGNLPKDPDADCLSRLLLVVRRDDDLLVRLGLLQLQRLLE